MNCQYHVPRTKGHTGKVGHPSPLSSPVRGKGGFSSSERPIRYRRLSVCETRAHGSCISQRSGDLRLSPACPGPGVVHCEHYADVVALSRAVNAKQITYADSASGGPVSQAFSLSDEAPGARPPLRHRLAQADIPSKPPGNAPAASDFHLVNGHSFTNVGGLPDCDPLKFNSLYISPGHK
ncbi:hypothetical protein DPEC_G00150710 [Dallia pectoralis]|uniref:Uncharacterized protein n=1 Tax=Dallia pectoralis TaxID=75939 RepID=A0ACC2GJE0_DALPE|nr:hypothetical protein DPEC_G00150710 [Dallia pectoralis]